MLLLVLWPLPLTPQLLLPLRLCLLPQDQVNISITSVTAETLIVKIKISKKTSTGIGSQYCLDAKPLASVPRRQLTSRILAEKGNFLPRRLTL